MAAIALHGKAPFPGGDHGNDAVSAPLDADLGHDLIEAVMTDRGTSIPDPRSASR
jgi:hypothetical protein